MWPSQVAEEEEEDAGDEYNYDDDEFEDYDDDDFEDDIEDDEDEDDEQKHDSGTVGVRLIDKTPCGVIVVCSTTESSQKGLDID